MLELGGILSIEGFPSTTADVRVRLSLPSRVCSSQCFSGLGIVWFREVVSC